MAGAILPVRKDFPKVSPFSPFFDNGFAHCCLRLGRALGRTWGEGENRLSMRSSCEGESFTALCITEYAHGSVIPLVKFCGG
jgi:hypothetical protein